MSEETEHQITILLTRWTKGDPNAFEALHALVHRELRGIARNRLKRNLWPSAFETTELVQEAYLSLLGRQKSLNWQNRQHFFNVVGVVMRRILVDHARKMGAIKRGGNQTMTDLDREEPCERINSNDIVLINEALEHLGKSDPDMVKLVELRFFTGFSITDTAEILGIPVTRCNRMWRMSKAILFDFINKRRLR